MVSISITSFDGDELNAKNTVINCKNIDIAKKLAKKCYQKCYDHYDEEDEWFKEHTKWYDNGGFKLYTSDGFDECKIIDSELVEDYDFDGKMTSIMTWWCE